MALLGELINLTFNYHIEGIMSTSVDVFNLFFIYILWKIKGILFQHDFSFRNQNKSLIFIRQVATFKLFVGIKITTKDSTLQKTLFDINPMHLLSSPSREFYQIPSRLGTLKLP